MSRYYAWRDMSESATQLPVLVEWAKALGLPALAVAVSVLSLPIARWQARVAREKLRHDLYDRRFAIYMAYHELLVAIAEKDDSDAELRSANAARAHSPFLLNAHLGTYLEELHAEAFRIDRTSKLVRDKSLPLDSAAISQLAHDRLAFTNRISELIEEFKPLLRLQDFSRSPSWLHQLMRQKS